MKVTASAPARIDLSGGATDWCGGHTLSVAINLRAYATVEKIDDPEMIVINDGNEEIKYKEPIYNGKMDLIKAVIELSKLKGFRLDFNTDIPRGSGLGGSAPLSVSILFALKKLFNKQWSKYYIAELAQRAETLKLETVQGYQDQYTATFGGLIFMDFEGKECQKDAYSKPIDQEPYTVVENLNDYLPEFHILVVIPEIDRGSSDDTNSSLSTRYLDGEKEVVDSINDMAKITQEAKKAIVDRDIERMYEIININNKTMDSWGFHSDNNKMIEDVARKEDILAVKVCGAGRAGMAIFTKDEEQRDLLFKKLETISKKVFKVKTTEGVRYE